MQSEGQKKIIDSLMEKPMDIQELVERTFLSDSYVRLQVKYLEKDGQVEKADKRIPYVYRIPTESPYKKRRELVEVYKTKIITKDSSNSIMQLLSKAPKDMWLEITEDFEAASIAIKELHDEGKLIETL